MRKTILELLLLKIPLDLINNVINMGRTQPAKIQWLLPWQQRDDSDTRHDIIMAR